jgi:hypothetical protein
MRISGQNSEYPHSSENRYPLKMAAKFKFLGTTVTTKILFMRKLRAD